jgi:hypothetical protein
VKRRSLLLALGALAFPAALPARQGYVISDAERLIAAIQDGGKIIYLLPETNAAQSRLLGQALRALRVPLNEILTGRTAASREAAEAAFQGLEVSPATELDFRPDDLLRIPPAPGNNRVLVGQRAPLETVLGRKMPELAEGAMAIFLPGSTIELLGTVTAERVIRGAERRGALPR